MISITKHLLGIHDQQHHSKRRSRQAATAPAVKPGPEVNTLEDAAYYVVFWGTGHPSIGGLNVIDYAKQSPEHANKLITSVRRLKNIYEGLTGQPLKENSLWVVSGGDAGPIALTLDVSVPDSHKYIIYAHLTNLETDASTQINIQDHPSDKYPLTQVVDKVESLLAANGGGHVRYNGSESPEEMEELADRGYVIPLAQGNVSSEEEAGKAHAYYWLTTYTDKLDSMLRSPEAEGLASSAIRNKINDALDRQGPMADDIYEQIKAQAKPYPLFLDKGQKFGEPSSALVISIHDFSNVTIKDNFIFDGVTFAPYDLFLERPRGVAISVYKNVDPIVQKHLPGQHDQETHGRPSDPDNEGDTLEVLALKAEFWKLFRTLSEKASTLNHKYLGSANDLVANNQLSRMVTSDKTHKLRQRFVDNMHNMNDIARELTGDNLPAGSIQVKVGMTRDEVTGLYCQFEARDKDNGVLLVQLNSDLVSTLYQESGREINMSVTRPDAFTMDPEDVRLLKQRLEGITKKYGGVLSITGSFGNNVQEFMGENYEASLSKDNFFLMANRYRSWMARSLKDEGLMRTLPKGTRGWLEGDVNDELEAKVADDVEKAMGGLPSGFLAMHKPVDDLVAAQAEDTAIVPGVMYSPFDVTVADDVKTTFTFKSFYRYPGWVDPAETMRQQFKNFDDGYADLMKRIRANGASLEEKHLPGKHDQKHHSGGAKAWLDETKEIANLLGRLSPRMFDQDKDDLEEVLYKDLTGELRRHVEEAVSSTVGDLCKVLGRLPTWLDYNLRGFSFTDDDPPKLKGLMAVAEGASVDVSYSDYPKIKGIDITVTPAGADNDALTGDDPQSLSFRRNVISAERLAATKQKAKVTVSVQHYPGLTNMLEEAGYGVEPNRVVEACSYADYLIDLVKHEDLPGSAKRRILDMTGYDKEDEYEDTDRIAKDIAKSNPATDVMSVDDYLGTTFVDNDILPGTIVPIGVITFDHGTPIDFVREFENGVPKLPGVGAQEALKRLQITQ